MEIWTSGNHEIWKTDEEIYYGPIINRQGFEKVHMYNEYVEAEGIYVISVAARLLQMHPQTLRKYERAGLVRPSRTVGMLRLYSEEDIVRLRLIKHLVGEMGLNLAGVEVALAMFNQMLRLKSGLDQAKEGELKDYLEDCLNEMFKILK